jgi:hypothetical protein
MAFHYNPTLVTDGCVYAFDAANIKSYSGSGLTVNGLVGIGGTLVNGVGFSSTNYGSFFFDGSNDYINTTFLVDFVNISVNVWFNSKTYTSAPNYACVLANQQSTSPYQSFDLRKKNGSTNTLQLSMSTTGSASEIANDIGNLSNDTWYNICFTYDGSNIKAYSNSVLAFTYPSVGNLRTSTIPLMIGQNPSFAGRNLFMNLSQVHIYNRALSSSEILQNFNATRGRYGI